MPEISQPCILSVGQVPPADHDRASFVHATSGARALELMKLLRFDLVAISPGVNDASIPQLIRQMRVIAPWQKWVLVGPGITDPMELASRCNGVLAVIDDVGDWSGIESLASSVSRRQMRPAALQA